MESRKFPRRTPTIRALHDHDICAETEHLGGGERTGILVGEAEQLDAVERECVHR